VERLAEGADSAEADDVAGHYDAMQAMRRADPSQLDRRIHDLRRLNNWVKTVGQRCNPLALARVGRPESAVGCGNDHRACGQGVYDTHKMTTPLSQGSHPISFRATGSKSVLFRNNIIGRTDGAPCARRC
jgi:hypothetical protein